MLSRFSRVTNTYNQHARAQIIAANRLITLLSAIEKPQRVLELGAGTGLLSHLLYTSVGYERLTISDHYKSLVGKGPPNSNFLKLNFNSAQPKGNCIHLQYFL